MVLFGNNMPIYYQNPGSELTPILDELGYYTGEYKETRQSPQITFCVVSPAESMAEELPFGTYTDYDRVLLMSQAQFSETNITEQSYVWIGPRLWAIGEYNQGKFGVNPKKHKKFIVRKIAEGVQWVRVALSEVTDGPSS